MKLPQRGSELLIVPGARLASAWLSAGNFTRSDLAQQLAKLKLRSLRILMRGRRTAFPIELRKGSAGKPPNLQNPKYLRFTVAVWLLFRNKAYTRIPEPSPLTIVSGVKKFPCVS